MARLVSAPTCFMTILLLIFGIVDSKPLPLFLGIWSLYQSALLIVAQRRTVVGLVAKLPLFQLLEDTLRHSVGRHKKSIDVGQKNRRQIAKETENHYTKHHVVDGMTVQSVATETAGSIEVVDPRPHQHIVETTITKEETSEMKYEDDEQRENRTRKPSNMLSVEKSTAFVASERSVDDIGDAIVPQPTEPSQLTHAEDLEIQPSITQFPSMSATASRMDFVERKEPDPELLTIDFQRNDSITPAPNNAEDSHYSGPDHEESHHRGPEESHHHEISITQKSIVIDSGLSGSGHLAV